MLINGDKLFDILNDDRTSTIDVDASPAGEHITIVFPRGDKYYSLTFFNDYTIGVYGDSWDAAEVKLSTKYEWVLA